MKINVIQDKDFEQNTSSSSYASKFVSRIPSAVLASLLLVGVSANAEAGKHHKHHKHSKATYWNSHTKTLNINGWKLTPGGFLAGEGVWRSRNIQSDIGSAFNLIPMPNSFLYYMNELRFSARQSRISLQVEGDYNPTTHITGVYENDWLGWGTANSVQSNSFNPRIRLLYANVDWTNTGWHFLAGQTWSLATLNNKGITPSGVYVPMTIENEFTVGSVWKRQPMFRLTKDFNKLVWASLSIENPQNTFIMPGCASQSVGVSAACGSPAGLNYINNIFYNQSGNLFLPNTVNFSLNHVPDVIGKLSYDPVISGHNLHVEGFAMYRDFYDRVYYGASSAASPAFFASNKDTSGWTGGVGAVLEVMPKFLDIDGQIMWGKGLGSYASGLLPDVTFGADGSLQPIREVAWKAGAVLHANPAWDFYLYGGEERQQPQYFQYNNTYYGIGFPTYNNTGCTYEGGTGCVAPTQELWQVTFGFWDKVYQGWFGDLRAGLQYSYTKKILFSGTGGQPVGTSFAPSTSDNMVFASVRYYPFTVPAVKPAFVK
jgi:hypothetical protein